MNLNILLQNIKANAWGPEAQKLKLSKIQPPKQKTSKPISFGEEYEVELLKKIPAPTRYTKAGNIAKRQPKPYQPGDIVYLKLDTEGNSRLVPFQRAGSGYEIILDAVENIDYKFI